MASDQDCVSYVVRSIFRTKAGTTDVFNIERSPNRHIVFGFGPHTCPGAPLARMETRIALKNLLDRNPNLRLGVERDELRVQRLPGWYRYESLPVVLG